MIVHSPLSKDLPEIAKETTKMFRIHFFSKRIAFAKWRKISDVLRVHARDVSAYSAERSPKLEAITIPDGA